MTKENQKLKKLMVFCSGCAAGKTYEGQRNT